MLHWVVRRSRRLEHRSVPEFLGIEFTETQPGLIYSKDEYFIDEILDLHPVDVIVDFSSEFSVHEILFGFPYQTVRMKHRSIAREAFGNGILFAIQNLPRKSRGFYTMENLLLT